MEGLITGLDDPDWNVRYRCARGLDTIRRLHPHLKASEERLLAVAEREGQRLSTANAAVSLPTSAAQSQSGESTPDGTIDLIFALFGALYEPETIELCRHALRNGDPGLRGTALEYLENLLPVHLWAQLQPVLAPGHTTAGVKRPLQQTAKDLLAAAASLRSKKRADIASDGAADTLD